MTLSDFRSLSDLTGEARLRPLLATDRLKFSNPKEKEPVTLKPSEVLDKAADLIEPEGAWCQHVIAKKGGRVFKDGGVPGWREADCFCVSGALLFAGEGEDREARRRLTRLIGQEPIYWNDAPNRTQSEVVKALRDAANLAKEEGQ